jgi:hypothetical protein
MNSITTLSDKYNYTLNGIQHQIPLHSNLIIQKKPLDEKILISLKFLMKYIHDLFDYHHIDYFLLSHTLLGQFIFKGIHIFHPQLEIGISSNHLYKLNKIKEEIIHDDFLYDDSYLPNYLSISSSFFKQTPVSLYIYIINQNEDDKKELFHHHENKKIVHQLYDVYPIEKVKFEEFEVCVPKKIENILNHYSFHLSFLHFKENEEESQKHEVMIIERPNEESLSSSISSISHQFFQKFTKNIF